MPTCRRTFALALPLVLLAFTGCGAPRAAAVLRTGSLAIDGDFGADTRNVRATSSASRLGLDRETVFQPQATLEVGRLFLEADYFSADWEGSGRADGVVSVPGQPPIRRGARVETKVGIDYFDLAAVWNFLPDPLFLGVGLGVGVVSYDLDFRSRPASISLDDSQPLAYPMVRFAADAEIFEFDLGLGGVSADLGVAKVDYFELDTSLSVPLFGGEAGPEGRAEIGYRHILLDYEFRSLGADVAVDATLSGPYLSFVIRF